MLARQMNLWTWTRDHIGEGGAYVGWLEFQIIISAFTLYGHAIVGVIWLTGIVFLTL